MRKIIRQRGRGRASQAEGMESAKALRQGTLLKGALCGWRGKAGAKWLKMCGGCMTQAGKGLQARAPQAAMLGPS